MCRRRKLGTRTRHCSLVTEFGVLRRTFWQVSRLILILSHTKVSIFQFRKGRSSNYSLESQPGELMLERFSWDNNWADRSTDKHRQSMTACGFCCYYLKYCSKTNHIAMKRTKYETVYGFAQYLLISKFLKMRLSVTWIKYLSSKLVVFLVERKKNCVILETNCMGKLKLQ